MIAEGETGEGEGERVNKGRRAGGIRRDTLNRRRRGGGVCACACVRVHTRAYVRAPSRRTHARRGTSVQTLTPASIASRLSALGTLEC
jgi:hypothetical protein